MKIDILTLFPEMFTPLQTSIIGRAVNSGKLDGLSPLKVLKRGYAFATINNKVIKEVKDVNVNETIKLSLQDGNINALVTSKESK